MEKRVLSAIKKYVAKLDLDLTGYSVLTEVGYGLYSYIPIIPLVAGAKRVMAWTRDSENERGDVNIKNCNSILEKLDFCGRIDFYNGAFEQTHLETADLITNSGFLRPLNQDKLKHVQDFAVIPLMYESWELRVQDIDIDYCKQRKIRVAGTNESHEKLQIFQQVGHLATKMIFEAGYEIFNNKIIIWSNDIFGKTIHDTLFALKPKKIIRTSSFETVKKNISNTDYIFLCDYAEKRSFNDESFFDFEALKKLNSDFGFIHLFGNIDNLKMKCHNIFLYPDQLGKAQQITFSLVHLGIEPFLALMVGGFKVGENLLKGNYEDCLVQKVTI